MGFEGYAEAFFAGAGVGDFADGGVEGEGSGEGEADGVVELHGEIRELQVGGEEVLAGFEGLGAAFDGVFFEDGAEFYLG
jgi:hypothetical protein